MMLVPISWIGCHPFCISNKWVIFSPSNHLKSLDLKPTVQSINQFQMQIIIIITEAHLFVTPK